MVGEPVRENENVRVPPVTVMVSGPIAAPTVVVSTRAAAERVIAGLTIANTLYWELTPT